MGVATDVSVAAATDADEADVEDSFMAGDEEEEGGGGGASRQQAPRRVRGLEDGGYTACIWAAHGRGHTCV